MILPYLYNKYKCFFSISTSYATLFVFAVPYGLVADAIDASVKRYVANKLINFILHQFGGLLY